MSIYDSKFSDNKANNGGVVYSTGKVSLVNSNFTNNAASINGGVVYSTDQVDIWSSYFEKNHADGNTLGNGGGVIHSQNKITIHNSNFTDNQAKYGGVIWNNGSSVEIIKSSFNADKADCGGVVYCTGKLTITDSNFYNHRASFGGAIYCTDIFNISNSNFSKCQAGGSYSGGGGAIYARSDSKNGNSTITNSIFKSNEALTSAFEKTCKGGAIYSHSPLIISNSNFTDNQANRGGAAIYSDSSLTISHSIFNNNRAYSGYGGAIHSKKELKISDSNFASNAANYGDDIYTAYETELKNNTYSKSSSTDNIYANNTVISDSVISVMGNKTYYISKGESYEVYAVITVDNGATIRGNLYDNLKIISSNTAYSTKWNYNRYIVSDGAEKNGTFTSETNKKYTASLNTDKKYTVKSAVIELKPDTSINIDTDNIHYGEEILIRIILDSKINSQVTVNFNNKNYTVDINKGIGRLNINDKINAGSYTVNVIFNGTEAFNPAKFTTNLTILKAQPTLKVEVDNVILSEKPLMHIQLNTDINDNIIANINQKEDIKIKITNGKGEYTINDQLPMGNYTYSVKYNGNNNYNPTNTTGIFTVSDKKYLKVNTEFDDLYYGGNIKANFTIVNNDFSVVPMIGTMTVKINNETYTVNIFDGKGALNIQTHLNAGKHNMELTIEETNEYNKYKENIEFTISKTDTNANITLNNINYGENIKGNIIITDTNSNIATINCDMTIKIENKTYTIKINNGKGTININDIIDAGKHKVEITINETDEFKGFKTNIELNIAKTNTTITASAEDIAFGDTGTLKIQLGTPINGTSTIKTPTGNIKINIINGKGELTLKNLTMGSHTFNITFDGNKNCNPTKNITIRIKVFNRNLEVQDLTKYYGNPDRLNITLKDYIGSPLANKTIKININGQEYNRITNENGFISMAINLGIGTYNTTISYNNLDINILITIKSTIEAKNIIKFCRNGTQYYAKFFDTNGQPLTNTNVTFNINGVFYTRTTNENGIAKLSINLDPNEYIITALNPTTNQQYSNNITVLTSISAANVVKYYKNGTQYYANFIKENREPLTNAEVSFNINGIIYKRITDPYGTATMTINLNPGKYIITAINPDTNQTYANTIEVLNTIQTEDLEMTTKERTPFKTTILDQKGKPQAGATVTFNINGVFYTRTTNENGIANLNINLISGKYIITTTYNGLSHANTIIIDP